MTEKELTALKNRFDIIGNDQALNRALEIAVAIAPTDLTVLVFGESGVGKENIPNIIHKNSLRRNEKYFAVNCGAIPEGTIDSELFGHEKGSFTGASEMRRGYFEEANGGTLFLDEIAELPLSSQAKLLRVLQSGEFIRVGSSKVLKTDVRVIAATNVNLMYAVQKGKFRADLYYRLNAVPIMMPALRERRDDIHLLFRKFAADFSEKYTRAAISLTEDAIVLLKNYRWPGNIRQLKNVAETVSALESVKMTPGMDRIIINAETLSKYIPKDDPNHLPAVSTRYSDGESINKDEREMIVHALYQLKQDVDALKEVVYSKGKAESQSMPVRPGEIPSWQEDVDEPDEQAYVEAVHQPEDESFSIHDANDDMIRKALEKYGSRKAAADALGISERTLYRKIKQMEAKQ